MSGDLLARSSAHWSEARRSGMDAFYRLATDDYRHLAEARDWSAWLTEAEASAGGRGLRLLDVACGSGKFPNALLRHAGVDEAELRPVATDLLDPSAFSIAEARNALPAPFVPAAEHETTLQDFVPPEAGYDIVWATHALYAVPPGELPAAAARFCDAIGPSGRGVIAHSAAAGHYIDFHRRYLSAFGAANAVPYVSAELFKDAFAAAGATVEVTEVRYNTTAAAADGEAVEGYLQRCVFDDSVSLDEMLTAPGLGDYLDACRTDGGWRFPQVVHLIDVTP
jgi:SAM-dependent methyltransferase